MPLNIKWPQHGSSGKAVKALNLSRKAFGRFVAFGRANDEVCGLAWSCYLISDPKVTACYSGFTFVPHKQGPHGHIRWSIMIRVPKEGKYHLEVTGHRHDGGTPYVAIADFSVVMIGVRGPIILWPDSHDKLGDYKNDFCPYGYISVHPLSTAVLSNSTTSIPLLSKYSDPIELEFWTAQFDTVSQEVFTLQVADGYGGTDHKGDLDFT